MSLAFHNPENALKRATEFLELGKYNEAVDCLCDILKNRKTRILKNTHEAIINKLLEICVNHKMAVSAKAGLYLYRNICQGINVKSWEDAIKKLLFLAEQKLKNTKEELQTVCYVNTVDHITTSKNTTEYFMPECNQNKEELEVELASWLKFMWECYRLCLELLRTSQMERIYHHIAQSACKFCLNFSRKIELRKLCNLLRMHFGYLFKSQLQPFSANENIEILILYLETGMIELECTLQLELWQDAFKTIEDIHLVISLLKKPTNSKIIACYYEKLAYIFWKSNDMLYHAAALFRFFVFSRELKKNLSADDVSEMSSCVVLAVLSAPFESSNPVADLITENDASVIDRKHRLLSSLVNFSVKPTRKLLVKNLEQYGIVQAALPEVQNVFKLLEHEIEPLKLFIKLSSLLKIISEWKTRWKLEQYFSPLYYVAIIRLLSQLSHIYKTITVKKLEAIVPSFNAFSLEMLVVDAARRFNIPIRIDHVNQCLYFNYCFDLFQNANTLDGPVMKFFPAENNLNHLCLLHNSLEKMASYLQPDEFRFKNMTLRENLKEQYLRVRYIHRRGILERKKIIEKHKEIIEKMRLKNEERERKLIIEQQLKHEAAERDRLLKEAEERDAQRRILQEKEIRKQILFEKVESLKKSEFGQMVEKLELGKLEYLDIETLLCKHIEYINREKKGFLSRLHRQERALDHLERAKRIEEIPLLLQQYDEEKITRKEMWDRKENLKIQYACEKRASIIKARDRYFAMKKDLKDFAEKTRQNKQLGYDKKCLEFLKYLEEQRDKRLKERAQKRKNHRKLVWLEEQKQRSIRQKERDRLITKELESLKAEKIRDKKLSPLKESTYSDQTKQRNFETRVKLPIDNEVNKRDYKNIQSNIEKTSPKKIVTKIYKPSDNQQRVEINTEQKLYETEERQPIKQYHILKHEENKVSDTEISKHLDAPGKEVAHSTTTGDMYGTSKYNIIQNRECLRREIVHFDRYPETVNQHSLSSQNKPTKQFSEHYFNRDNFQFQSLEEDVNWRRDNNEPYRRMQPHSEYQHSANIPSPEEERIQHKVNADKKYDKTRSCTPWAKLKRKDDAE